MNSDDGHEIVRRARSAFFAGKPSDAWMLIHTEADRLKAASNQMYREALEQISVDLAAFLGPSEIPQITELDLTRRGILDKHMPLLGRLISIKKLNLGFNEITDAGLPHLGALVFLEDLNLQNDTTITDEGVKYLAALTSLSVLDLRDTRLSNQGLNHLLGLRSLTHLYASHTTVTAQGAQDFKSKWSGLNRLPKPTVQPTVHL